MKEIRLAIGNAAGLRSTVWRIWTHKNEFYLLSRMMGSSMKVSIHSGGQAQWSMQSEWYGSNRPNQPNQARHIEKWRWNEPEGNTATKVFRLFIPKSELREVHLVEDLTDVNWLSEPNEGQQVQLVFYVSPASTELAPVEAPGFVCALSRLNSGSIVVFALYQEITTCDFEQVRQVHTRLDGLAKSGDLEIKPGYRMVAFATDDMGTRGMIEFVPPGA